MVVVVVVVAARIFGDALQVIGIRPRLVLLSRVFIAALVRKLCEKERKMLAERLVAEIVVAVSVPALTSPFATASFASMLCVKVNSRLDRNAEMTRKTCASVYRGIKSRGLGRDVDVIAHVHPLAPHVSRAI